jgi:Putative MetA-pathway of phenol degradation
MRPRRLFVAFVFVSLLTAVGVAQIPGPCGEAAKQGKVGCTLSTLYGGASGFPIYQGGNPYTGGGPVFDSSFTDFTGNVTALAATLGTELTTLPLTAPGSGFVFQLDRASGLEVRSTQSLGPILAERGETIGRHKLFVAFTYQYFHPTSDNGINMKSLHNVYQHGTDQSQAEEYDFITTNETVDLKIHEFAAFLTYGLTDRIDVSAVIPILDVRMGATGIATIHNSDPFVTHSFCQATVCLTDYFSSFRDASGIGDIVFRVKARVWGGERTKFALGADVRVPTGDELNFLGSGAYGVRPFAALSYSKNRFAPHANVGFQVNGNSILAGLTTGVSTHLPNEATYSAGADLGVTHRFTVAADWLGEHVINGFEVRSTTCGETFDAPPPPATPSCVPGTTAGSGGFTASLSQNVRTSYSVDDLALGVKISPLANLLITANALIKLDDPGLRSTVVPLVGIGYTF